MFDRLTRTAEYGGYCIATAALLALGFHTGLNVQSYTVDLLVATVHVVLLDAASSSLGFALFGSVTGLLLFREVRTDPEDPDHEGPPVTAIVPVYRDAEALSNSVESLAAAAYEDLRVVVVGEHDDAASRREAVRLTDRYDCVEWLENGYAGSKAGAINYAVEHSETDYFAVFDADETVDADFVSAAMQRLVDAEYEVFQGRRVPQPTGPIETIAYCERVLFHAGYKLVEPVGFRNCRSSSTVFSRVAFEAVGGYDDVLTEDLDFSHQIYRAGVPVARARYRTNAMEAPHTLWDMWGQRKRWRIGQIEVLHRTLRELLRSPDARTVVSTARIVSSLLGSVFLLTLVSKFLILLLFDAEVFYLLPLSVILGTVAAVAAVDHNNGDIDGLSVSLLATPLVYPFFGLMTLKSLFEYLLSWDGEWYHVEKFGQ